MSLWYVATRAGVSDRSPNWLLNYVRMLQANEGFPAALPYYGLNEKKRSGITIHSRWPRPAVDAWFDGFLPPRLAAVAADRQSARDAHKLDARAGELATAASR